MPKKTTKKFKAGTTCKQAFESKKVKIFPSIDGEFIAYKPEKRNGTIDNDFNLASLLESLSFYDYEEIACGRAYYVMGDVNSPANEDEADAYFADK